MFKTFIQDNYSTEAYSSNTYGEEKKSLPKNLLKKRTAVAAGQVEKYTGRFYAFAQYKANPRSQSIEYMPCLEEDEEIMQPETKLNTQTQQEVTASIKHCTAEIGVI